MSDGCRYCYAEALTDRLSGGGFEIVTTHPKRLSQVRDFRPIVADGDSLMPRLVFVNSMSDLMHEDIPDAFRDQVLDAIETMPTTIFQVLTKRPMTMRRVIEARYAGRGVPANLWLGVSVEDNKVRSRIDALRRLKDAVGDFTAFLSVEPLINMPDKHDYTGVEQVLIGGCSRQPKGFFPCEEAWVAESIERARAAGSAIWFKQWGMWDNNPLYQRAHGRTVLDRVKVAIAAGERLAKIVRNKEGREVIEGEKGGATFRGEIFRELPPSYARMTEALRRPPAGKGGALI